MVDAALLTLRIANNAFLVVRGAFKYAFRIHTSHVADCFTPIGKVHRTHPFVKSRVSESRFCCGALPTNQGIFLHDPVSAATDSGVCRRAAPVGGDRHGDRR